jgi:hypothetical protein
MLDHRDERVDLLEAGSRPVLHLLHEFFADHQD